METAGGKNQIGIILPESSRSRCFLTWISASILTAVNAIIPNSAAISQLIKNDRMTEAINSGRSLTSAMTGTLIMSDPIRRMEAYSGT